MRAKSFRDLIVKGGFPNFLLPLVNFDALFAQASESPQPGSGQLGRIRRSMRDAARKLSRWRSSARAPGERRSPFIWRAPDIRPDCGAATRAHSKRCSSARRNLRYLPAGRISRRARCRRGFGAGAAGRARCAGGGALACISRDARAARAASGSADTRIAWATKGFEIGDRAAAASSRAARCFGARPGAVFRVRHSRGEVGAGLPTAMTVASRDELFAKELVLRLSGPRFRAYTQSDIMGVEVGGAVKNVIAIGSGIADGMGFGANTRVALITRGLAEMMRLGRQARRPARDLHGPRGSRRPGTHLHRRSVAQSAPGVGARAAAQSLADAAARHSSSGRRGEGGAAPCATSPSAWGWRCPFAARSIASCHEGKPVRAARAGADGQATEAESDGSSRACAAREPCALERRLVKCKAQLTPRLVRHHRHGVR